MTALVGQWWFGWALAAAWAAVLVPPPARAGWRAWLRHAAARDARAEAEADTEVFRLRAWAGPVGGVALVLATTAPMARVHALPPAPAAAPVDAPGPVTTLSGPARVVVPDRRLRWELQRAAERLAWDVMVAHHLAEMRALADRLVAA